MQRGLVESSPSRPCSQRWSSPSVVMQCAAEKVKNSRWRWLVARSALGSWKKYQENVVRKEMQSITIFLLLSVAIATVAVAANKHRGKHEKLRGQHEIHPFLPPATPATPVYSSLLFPSSLIPADPLPYWTFTLPSPYWTLISRHRLFRSVHRLTWIRISLNFRWIPVPPYHRMFCTWTQAKHYCFAVTCSRGHYTALSGRMGSPPRVPMTLPGMLLMHSSMLTFPCRPLLTRVTLLTMLSNTTLWRIDTSALSVLLFHSSLLLYNHTNSSTPLPGSISARRRVWLFLWVICVEYIYEVLNYLVFESSWGEGNGNDGQGGESVSLCRWCLFYWL